MHLLLKFWLSTWMIKKINFDILHLSGHKIIKDECESCVSERLIENSIVGHLFLSHFATYKEIIHLCILSSPSSRKKNVKKRQLEICINNLDDLWLNHLKDPHSINEFFSLRYKWRQTATCQRVEAIMIFMSYKHSRERYILSDNKTLREFPLPCARHSFMCFFSDTINDDSSFDYSFFVCEHVCVRKCLKIKFMMTKLCIINEWSD